MSVCHTNARLPLTVARCVLVGHLQQESHVTGPFHNSLLRLLMHDGAALPSISETI